MADNDNTQPSLLSPDQIGITPDAGSSNISQIPMARDDSRNYRKIKINFDFKSKGDKNPATVPPDNDGEPDMTNATVLSTQILYPVSDVLASRIPRLTSLGRDIWVVGQAKDMLPGTVIVKNNPGDALFNEQGIAQDSQVTMRNTAALDTGGGKPAATGAKPAEAASAAAFKPLTPSM